MRNRSQAPVAWGLPSPHFWLSLFMCAFSQRKGKPRCYRLQWQGGDHGPLHLPGLSQLECRQAGRLDLSVQGTWQRNPMHSKKAHWLEQSHCGREGLVSDQCHSVSGSRNPTDTESITTFKNKVIGCWSQEARVTGQVHGGPISQLPPRPTSCF